MARGGQGGLSFLGEDKAFTAGATLAVTLLLQMQLGCFGDGDPSAAEKNNEQCEEIAAKQARGEDLDDDEQVIFTQDWCREHMVAVEIAAEAEQQVKLAEAQQDLQEAQTP